MSSHYNRIFAALDGTPAQVAVARKALELARENHAHLLLGHVVDAVAPDAAGYNPHALAAGVQTRIEEQLADILSEARASKELASVEVQVQTGSVAETIMKRLIDPFRPDLVVCGQRGLSNVKYLVVGSVSTHLIRHLRCDVLVVHQ